MIKLVVTMQIKPGKMPAFIELFNRLQPSVLAEEGCREYHLFREIEGGTDTPDPDSVVLLEQWDSIEHLQAHLATELMRDFKREAAELRASVNLKIVSPISR